jgi:epoxyqueuosine reductase
MALTEAVKAEAQRLGFQLVGVTTPASPPHIEVFERWLEAGRQGEMGYLATERARQRRADPRLILPECRSILVLGVRYPALASQTPREQGAVESQKNTEPAGRVAAYAWGLDYHDVLKERLQALVVFIEREIGHTVPNRWYTDTGPVLERELAQRAGLGWIGKNTCLINPKQGSYFLLAEILLGIDLEPDEPFAADRCGSCTRCLEACPTGCILPDRTLDASRCISYLTIELKGAIPLYLRPQMGDWIFGCDVCQQVCPWNLRFATPQGDPAFATPPDGGSSKEPMTDPSTKPRINLTRELSLTTQEFSRKFKGSPVKRAKRRGYLRNVALALGNAGDPTAVPALEEALLKDLEPLVRGHAAWALGRTGGELAREALAAALRGEADSAVREEIRLALGEES